MENSSTTKKSLAVMYLKQSALCYHLLQKPQELGEDGSVLIIANIYDPSQGYNLPPIISNAEVLVEAKNISALIRVDVSDANFYYKEEETRVLGSIKDYSKKSSNMEDLGSVTLQKTTKSLEFVCNLLEIRLSISINEEDAETIKAGISAIDSGIAVVELALNKFGSDTSSTVTEFATKLIERCKAVKLEAYTKLETIKNGTATATKDEVIILAEESEEAMSKLQDSFDVLDFDTFKNCTAKAEETFNKFCAAVESRRPALNEKTAMAFSMLEMAGRSILTKAKARITELEEIKQATNN